MEYQTTYVLDCWGCFLVPIFSWCPLWSCFLMVNMPTKCLLCLLRREKNIQQTNRQGDAHAQTHSTAQYKTQICVRHLFKTAASCTSGANTEPTDFLCKIWCIEKCSLKTLYVDKYISIFCCIQPLYFIVSCISDFLPQMKLPFIFISAFRHQNNSLLVCRVRKVKFQP